VAAPEDAMIVPFPSIIMIQSTIAIDMKRSACLRIRKKALKAAGQKLSEDIAT
jgi:hypothetical protein